MSASGSSHIAVFAVVADKKHTRASCILQISRNHSTVVDLIVICFEITAEDLEDILCAGCPRGGARFVYLVSRSPRSHAALNADKKHQFCASRLAIRRRTLFRE